MLELDIEWVESPAATAAGFVATWLVLCRDAARESMAAHGHPSPADAAIRKRGADEKRAAVLWAKPDPGQSRVMLRKERVEWAAEAFAFATAGVLWGRRVLRRVEETTGADWMLVPETPTDTSSGLHLEVGGRDEPGFGELVGKLNQKVARLRERMELHDCRIDGVAVVSDPRSLTLQGGGMRHDSGARDRHMNAAEALACQADDVREGGNETQALQLYAHAVRETERAIAETDPDLQLTYDILTSNAFHLWAKANEPQNAGRITLAYLEDGPEGQLRCRLDIASRQLRSQSGGTPAAAVHCRTSRSTVAGCVGARAS